MPPPSFDLMLDNMWDEAKGTFDLGNGVNMTFDVRPKISKETWKREWQKDVLGYEDFADVNGRIIMPNLGII